MKYDSTTPFDMSSLARTASTFNGSGRISPAQAGRPNIAGVSRLLLIRRIWMEKELARTTKDDIMQQIEADARSTDDGMPVAQPIWWEVPVARSPGQHICESRKRLGMHAMDE
ncbi:hypothetical protein AB4851_10045 [Burkholderia sp. 22PA0099]|uniref:hypothetical protein n=1 Tax=Burkholderia sp. 22PA0099 TaxID=3237372 RepID=UPI0039C30C90